MVLFCRLGTRRVRNDCCEERQERKYVELNQKPRLIYKKAKFFSFTPNTWKKFCLEAPNLNTVRDAIILTGKKMVKVTMYQGIIYRFLSVRMVTHQRLPNCLGDAGQSNGGDQQNAADWHSLSNLCRSDLWSCSTVVSKKLCWHQSSKKQSTSSTWLSKTSWGSNVTIVVCSKIGNATATV